jgi:hypothetical protein
MQAVGAVALGLPMESSNRMPRHQQVEKPAGFSAIAQRFGEPQTGQRVLSVVVAERDFSVGWLTAAVGGARAVLQAG